MPYHFVDYKTRRPVEPKNLVFTGRDNPWEVVTDLDAVRARDQRQLFQKGPAAGKS